MYGHADVMLCMYVCMYVCILCIDVVAVGDTSSDRPACHWVHSWWGGMLTVCFWGLSISGMTGSTNNIRYVAVIRFNFHVVQILPIIFTQRTFVLHYTVDDI